MKNENLFGIYNKHLYISSMSFLRKIFPKNNKYLDLQKENVELKAHNSKLELRISELETQLKFSLIKKDSHNSSLPPANDIIKKNQSLRSKSIRKPGGQKGHKGHTLQFSETPDTTITLIPQFCNKCGCELDAKQAILQSKRQVVDIPPVLPVFTEYQNYHINCHCGHCQESDYPQGVDNYIQYGPNIQASITYQSVYQYTPYKRLQDFFRQWYSLNISQGTITNVLNKMAEKALPLYYAIRDRLKQSKTVGSDETGASVNGKKQWIWVWQNALMTFICLASSRGQKVISHFFPEGFPNAIIGSDRWAAQLNTQAKGHQLCFAHLLRDLVYLIEAEKSKFAKEIKDLFLTAIKLKKEKLKYSKSDPIVLQVERKLNILLKNKLSTGDYPKTETFRKSMIKHRNSIFTFLYYKNVEPDNNASERAIRNIKVKQKISGQFKTKLGGESFTILRSVIDTAIKAKADVKEVLEQVALSN